MNGGEQVGEHPHSVFSTDYYQRLGVDRKASEDEIKAAFRKLARLYHTDVSKDPNAKAKFQSINEAYGVLSDTQKRAKYDNFPTGTPDFSPPPNAPQQQPPQDEGFFGQMFKGWGDFFKGNATGQSRERYRNPLEARANELRTQIAAASSVAEMLQIVNSWLLVPENAGLARMNFFPNFIGITVDSIQKLLIATQQDSINAEIFLRVLEEVTLDNPDPTAEHIAAILKKIPRGAAKQAYQKPPYSNPDPPQWGERKSEPPQTAIENENDAIEDLLSKLLKANKLEDAIIALQNWVQQYSKFQNTSAMVFNNFSPAQLLSELQAFTTGRFNNLNQSTHILGAGPVAMGMKDKVVEYLERKNLVGRKKVDLKTKKEGVESGSNLKSTEPPKPVDAIQSGSPEINRLRETLLLPTITSLEAVLKQIQANLSTLANLPLEHITLKPQISASNLANTLALILEGRMNYDKTKFFIEAIAARNQPDFSPVAKKLLELAEQGKLQ